MLGEKLRLGEGVRATARHRAAHVRSLMTDREPPRHLRYDLDEALDLLAGLEDARDALLESGHLPVVVDIEHHIRLLSRRLDFDDPQGETDEH